MTITDFTTVPTTSLQAVVEEFFPDAAADPVDSVQEKEAPASLRGRLENKVARMGGS